MKVFALSLALVLALASSFDVRAQTAVKEYAPVVGQSGKDVIWVPTPDALITRMLQMAEVTSKDHVMDLGSGDGRIPIAAAKEFGATAVGIEYNPDMVALSTRNAERAGVTDKVKFVQADIYETDLSKADVIAMYLLPKINLRLRPKLLTLRPGTRIVTHAFDMGDWQADQEVTLDTRQAYLWIVPAQVAGRWKIGADDEKIDVILEQKYQMLSGRAQAGKKTYVLSEGRVRGEDVHFVLTGSQGERREFSGRVQNKQLVGSFKNIAAVRSELL